MKDYYCTVENKVCISHFTVRARNLKDAKLMAQREKSGRDLSGKTWVRLIR